jgi:hypothetical protein
MSRLIARLKYVPAVLLGLVLIVLLASWFASAGVAFVVPFTRDEVWLEVQGSTVEFALNVYYLERMGPHWATGRQLSLRNVLGFVQFRYHMGLHGRPVLETEMPLPLMAALMLPLAVGPFLRFRFPLWSYFAWTALLAAEMAYYLR